MPANNKKIIREAGEAGVIAMIDRLVPQTGVCVGIGDDAAVLPSPGRGRRIVLTADMLTEGVHFRRRDGGRLIGRKALACSISDIAAMGGVPEAAVVSLGVTGREPVGLIREIYRGLAALAREFGVTIVGGDTVRSRGLVINVTLMGWVEPKNLITRHKAGLGDFVFVTGPLGGSLKSGRHYTFTPRVAEARYLVAKYKPTAMIDISDGLTTDLWHLLKETKTGALLYEELIPRHKGASLRQALYDGEDFELLFCLSPMKAERLLSHRPGRYPFYCIGQLAGRRAEITLVDSRGRKTKLRAGGFHHF